VPCDAPPSLKFFGRLSRYSGQPLRFSPPFSLFVKSAPKKRGMSRGGKVGKKFERWKKLSELSTTFSTLCNLQNPEDLLNCKVPEVGASQVGEKSLTRVKLFSYNVRVRCILQMQDTPTENRIMCMMRFSKFLYVSHFAKRTARLVAMAFDMT